MLSLTVLKFDCEAVVSAATPPPRHRRYPLTSWGCVRSLLSLMVSQPNIGGEPEAWRTPFSDYVSVFHRRIRDADLSHQLQVSGFLRPTSVLRNCRVPCRCPVQQLFFPHVHAR